MFFIELQDKFTASHAVPLPSGQQEASHVHQWRVRVFLGRDELDENGMVADFHWAGEHLRTILAGLEGKDLNQVRGLTPSPTAEVVTRFIFDNLTRRLDDPHLKITAVAVREAENCWAWYVA